jgi:hypothetical protein
VAQIRAMQHAMEQTEQSTRAKAGDWMGFYQNARGSAKALERLDLPPPLKALWCERWNDATTANTIPNPQLASELSSYFKSCPS